jgi:uncharacterized protein YjbI with pentapeptide repeats
MRLQELGHIEKYQQTLCNFISFMLPDGMPREELKLTNFYEENRQGRHAEEALLVVLNACAKVTKKVSEIKWHSCENFGVWIYRLRGQRLDYISKIFCLNYLSHLNLQNSIVIHQYFYTVNLLGTDLLGTNLEEADLRGTILEGKDLTNLNTDTDSSTV